MSVLITNMSHLYASPVINAPVHPDADFPNHKPSDHNVPVVFPLRSMSEISKSYRIKKFRPLPESGIIGFGQWITRETWSALCEKRSSTDKVEEFLGEMVDYCFPVKTARVRDGDLPFFTAQLKALDEDKSVHIEKVKNLPNILT